MNTPEWIGTATKRYLLSFIISILALGSLIPGSARADTCGSGGVIVVAGTNASRDAQGRPTGGVTGIGNRYAAQGYRVTYVRYPTHLWPLGPISYDDDVELGKSATRRAVVEYQRRCPGRPVVIAGFSQGARIAGDVLSDTANGRNEPVRVGNRYYTIRKDRLSGELYSDPRRAGRGGFSGVENILVGLLPGMTMSGPRTGGFGSIPVTQVCAAGDGVCDAPDPLHDPLGAADALHGYFEKHGYYPTRMRHRPATRAQGWGPMHCRQTGATRDCLIPMPASATLAGHRAAALGDPLAGLYRFGGALVEHRVALPLPEQVRVASLRPLVGGGADSTSGDLRLTADYHHLGLVHLDIERSWGSTNDLTVRAQIGLGVGLPWPIQSIPLLETQLSIGLTDSRELIGSLLNPTLLTGDLSLVARPPSSLLPRQAPAVSASVTPEGTALAARVGLHRAESPVTAPTNAGPAAATLPPTNAGPAPVTLPAEPRTEPANPLAAALPSLPVPGWVPDPIRAIAQVSIPGPTVVGATRSDVPSVAAEPRNRVAATRTEVGAIE